MQVRSEPRPLTANLNSAALASDLFSVLALTGGNGHLILSAHPASQGPTPQALQAYRNAGARLVVTLLPEHETAALGLQQLKAECARSELRWERCPIQDFSAPGDAFERAWSTVAPDVHALLDQGAAVVLHCRAGLGRTGTVAARVLMERGAPVQQALDQVRRIRPGSIETSPQESYLRALAASLRRQQANSHVGTPATRDE